MSGGSVARAATGLALIVIFALLVGRWARIGWESHGGRMIMEQQQTKSTTYEALFEGVCVTHTVTTAKMGGETQEEFCQRHTQALRADMTGDYPPKENRSQAEVGR